MKISRMIGVLLWVVGICLTSKLVARLVWLTDRCRSSACRCL